MHTILSVSLLQVKGIDRDFASALSLILVAEQDETNFSNRPGQAHYVMHLSLVFVIFLTPSSTLMMPSTIRPNDKHKGIEDSKIRPRKASWMQSTLVSNKLETKSSS